MLLSEGWKKEAERWAAWARKPGHDSYWRFHRDQFLELLPTPGSLTVDIGCGEGRLTRDLKQLGHNLMSFDVSETLVKLAQEEDPAGFYAVADATEIPLEDKCADLAVSFMTLQDVDNLDDAVCEMARILKPGMHACIAIVHPLNSAGVFNSDDASSEFVIRRSYMDEYQYSDELTRDGLTMTFHSVHRPLEAYSRALEKAGMLIEALREHKVPDSAIVAANWKRWQRIPLFLHIRAVKLT